MKKEFIRYFFGKRLIELFLPMVLLSAAATLLNIVGLASQRYIVFGVLLVFQIVFLSINIKEMRKCYAVLADTRLHYKVNFGAYGIFAAANFVLYFLLPHTYYTWCFALTKMLVVMGAGKILSFLEFHLVGIVAILVSPVGVRIKE